MKSSVQVSLQEHGDYRRAGQYDRCAAIKQTAQGILDARALHPDASPADLYDPLTMPPNSAKHMIGTMRRS